jgi:hypothetical protein
VQKPTDVVAADVRRLTYPANRLRDQTYSSSQPGVSSSGFCELCVFVLKGKFPSHPKFQKKPVFALIRGLCDSYRAGELSAIAFLFSATTDHGQLATEKSANVDFPTAGLGRFQTKPVFALIRGLCDSHPAREFSTITFLFSTTTHHGQRTTDKPKNVDSAPPAPPLFARVQNPFKKARESAIIHVSTFDSAAPKPSNIRTLNLQAALRTSHSISPKTPAISAFSPNPTSTCHLTVDPSEEPRSGYYPQSKIANLKSKIPVSLQKINFFVSATLKQPPLQINELRQIFTGTAKNTETLKLKDRAINLSNVLPPPAISALILDLLFLRSL